jgi:hypothetical protein
VDFGDAAIFIPAHGAFGEDVWARAFPISKGAGDYFLGVAKAVDGGGIDPIDTELEGAVNGGNRIIVVLRAPAELPTASADGPCSVTHAGYVQV